MWAVRLPQRFGRSLWDAGWSAWAAPSMYVPPDAVLRSLLFTTSCVVSRCCRFGFIGPVELSTSAFLFANLAHVPSERWRERFLAEAFKFRVSVATGSTKFTRYRAQI